MKIVGDYLLVGVSFDDTHALCGSGYRQDIGNFTIMNSEWGDDKSVSDWEVVRAVDAYSRSGGYSRMSVVVGLIEGRTFVA